MYDIDWECLYSKFARRHGETTCQKDLYKGMFINITSQIEIFQSNRNVFVSTFWPLEGVEIVYKMSSPNTCYSLRSHALHAKLLPCKYHKINWIKNKQRSRHPI